tara:strand:+ start:42 stop:731 length:690 start_codon:yes stop_codon:yes gene_type:complete
MIIAVIPARAGSKRIKNKNIKKIFGKPIISYPISQALKSKIFDKVIVSTESTKIANISKKYGAEIIFKRPKKLSGDNVLIPPVMEHAVKWVEKNVTKIDYACLIFPTAAMIESKDIVKAYKKIKSKNWNYVFSANKFSYPVQRSFYKKKNNSLKMLYKKNYNKKSQDFKPVYHDAGQFYWGKSKSWLLKKKIFGPKSSIHLINNLNSHDVDDYEDLKTLKKLMKLKKLK